VKVSPAFDLRFGARTAAFAALTVGTIGRYEVERRGLDGPGDEALVTSTMRTFGTRMCRIFGIDLDVEGIDPRGFEPAKDGRGIGRVFISNHRSSLDIFVTLALFEGRLVSRADLASWPLVGKGAKKAGVLFVDRDDRRSAANVLHQMIDRVQRGIGVIIFPEGTTYEGDEVRPFKPGALAVARRTGCEIVPIGLAYAGGTTAFGDESFLHHMRRVAGAPKTRVAVTVGAPIRAETNDTAALTREAHDRVQALVIRSRARADAGRAT